MNRMKLKNILEKVRVPENLYSLYGGLPNESYCLDKQDDKWEVYYSERGSKTDLEIFDTEDVACQYFLNKIKDIL